MRQKRQSKTRVRFRFPADVVPEQRSRPSRWLEKAKTVFFWTFVAVAGVAALWYTLDVVMKAPPPRSLRLR